MSMELAHPEFIVDTEWLAAHLDDPAIRVLDCTTHLLPRPGNVLYDVLPGRADFEKAHIPGAGFVDMEHDVSRPDPKLHFMRPTAGNFARAMSALGISNTTRVIAYSSANHWWATRMWWLLRSMGHDNAAVLNGGLQRWQAEGRPMESGQGKSRSATVFKAHPRDDMAVGKEQVLGAIGARDVLTVNALRPEQHTGSGGTSYGRLGHIRGSVNIPATHLVDANNMFKPIAELRALCQDALQAPQVITYCGGGIAATSVTLVLAMLGQEKVRVYDASLTEWASDASLPMET
jgi:thiosulfate/3-mercaptopyruvate sulfurtransferase